jgi:hypothetical protein
MKKHELAAVGFIGAGAMLVLGCADAQLLNGGQGGASGNGGGGQSGSSGIHINNDAGISVPIQTDPGQAPVPCDNNVCADFPSDPVIDGKDVPQNPGSQFSGSPSGSPPCLVEPEDGSLYPYNWTRPRIKWIGASGLAQITIHADMESKDLVVYTKSDNWVMDKQMWSDLAKHVHEQDVSVTVRIAGGGAATAKFQIASASAAGSIVFWAADPTAVGNQNVTTVNDSTSFLRGFTVGEEGVADTLKFSQAKQLSRADSAKTRTPTCVGCHSATPDSGYVAFVDNWPWNAVIAGVKPDNVGAQLPNLSVGGLADLNKPWGGPATFSGNVWKDGKRMMVTTSAEQNEQTPWSTDNKQPAKLVWYNLDSPTPPTLNSVGADQQPIAQMSANNYGIIARNGDSNGVAFPTWSHDGNTIIYSSTNGGCMDGRLEKGATDLYSVPYNGGNGGDAKPVPGASDKSWEEYYAAYSPDDAMVLFDRIPSGQVMYANEAAEMYFVPLAGAGSGTAQRLAANDPVSCSDKKSPGINNHFPKWAPVAQTYKDRTYYWVIYSSNRAQMYSNGTRLDCTGPDNQVCHDCVKSSYDGKCHRISQLYLTAISVENGTYKTYKSVYLWWQAPPKDKYPMVNTTPVWDLITIPPAPPIL